MACHLGLPVKMGTFKMPKTALLAITIGFAITPAFALEDTNLHDEVSNISTSNLERLERPTEQDKTRLAATCTIDDYELSGTQKICYYRCGGRTTAIQISVGSVCPRVIDG